MNDLVLTGCVDAVQNIDRPWVPRDASNATGDRLRTDGRIAVVLLNACDAPHRADTPAVNEKDLGTRPKAPLRAARDTSLTIRNDLLRGNFVYQGYEGIRIAVNQLRQSKHSSGGPRVVHYGGQQWEIVPGPKDLAKVKNAPKDPYEEPKSFVANPADYATFLEFSLSSGYSRFANDRFSSQQLDVSLPFGSEQITTSLDARTSLSAGWNIAINSTFNAHRYFSHELGFTWNRTKVTVDLAHPLLTDNRVRQDGDIRQFHYALLAHARPNGKRLRPYAAIGGGMQVIRLTESQQSTHRILRFAFKEANAFYSAFRFGSDPPFEGGGIFQGTFHYGAGVKYHLTRRIVLRTDFRETLSPQPDFWTKSYPSLRAITTDGMTVSPGPLTKSGPLRQQRFSLGIGVTF